MYESHAPPHTNTHTYLDLHAQILIHTPARTTEYSEGDKKAGVAKLREKFDWRHTDMHAHTHTNMPMLRHSDTYTCTHTDMHLHT